jgi:hypothetical protein
VRLTWLSLGRHMARACRLHCRRGCPGRGTEESRAAGLQGAAGQGQRVSSGEQQLVEASSGWHTSLESAIM